MELNPTWYHLCTHISCPHQVAMDRESGEIKPFQVLSTRKRKDADVDSIKVQVRAAHSNLPSLPPPFRTFSSQVCVFAFDMIFLNGKSLLQEPLSVRRDALHKSFELLPAEFQFAVAVADRTRDVHSAAALPAL